jgi:type II secretory pathway component PulF
MPTFEYSGMNNHGEPVDGRVEAANDEEAQRQIRQLGYFVTNLRQIDSGAPSRGVASSKKPSPGKPWGRDPDLVQLLRAGRSVEAIRLHREATGSSLREAKDYVYKLAERHSIKTSGCSIRAGALVLVLCSSTYGLCRILASFCDVSLS